MLFEKLILMFTIKTDHHVIFQKDKVEVNKPDLRRIYLHMVPDYNQASYANIYI